MKTEQYYDYIIAGGGCAGLALAYQISLEPRLRSKRILILEQTDKNQNDRTWCFWEKVPGPFEKIVTHSWDTAWFKSPKWSKSLRLEPYRYKMIQSADYYHFIHNHLQSFPNIEFKKLAVSKIGSDQNEAYAETESYIFKASWLFNSIPPKPKQQEVEHHYLLQHFKGLLIETEAPIFDPAQPTLMDFTIDQQQDCRFMYVLPLSEKKALVEYTLFSKSLLTQVEYDEALANYLEKVLKISHFKIIHEEFGVIPMFSEPFHAHPEPRVVNIGTAGGQTKSSTGYTFTRIQKHSLWLTRQLAENKIPVEEKRGWEKRFDLYDNVLLHVLARNVVKGERIFRNLFRYNSPAAVFRFLDEDSHFIQEYRLMNTVPILKFIGPAIQELRRLRN